MSVDTAAFEVADAIGPDYISLQPPGEQRFEPATIAVAIGFWVLQAAFAGIADGIKEASKDATKPVVTTVLGAVKRLTRDYVRRAFGSGETDKEALERRRSEVETQTMAARQAIAELPQNAHTDLIDSVAVAVREGLREQGLPDKPGDRVQRAVKVQIQVLLS